MRDWFLERDFMKDSITGLEFSSIARLFRFSDD